MKPDPRRHLVPGALIAATCALAWWCVPYLQTGDEDLLRERELARRAEARRPASPPFSERQLAAMAAHRAYMQTRRDRGLPTHDEAAMAVLQARLAEARAEAEAEGGGDASDTGDRAPSRPSGGGGLAPTGAGDDAPHGGNGAGTGGGMPPGGMPPQPEFGDEREYASGPDHEDVIRAVELADNSVLITTPDISFGFELDPANFEHGTCFLSNLTDGDFRLIVTSSGGGTLINGEQVATGTPVAVEEGMIIQSAGPAKITVLPGDVPPPERPSTSG